MMTVRAPRYMDAFQFSKLQAAREAVPEGASVEVFEHAAQCPACKCAPIARLEARVTMPWNGWLLVRQYALIST
jgi:formate dehydrogenase maturation protein FdhE